MLKCRSCSKEIRPVTKMSSCMLLAPRPNEKDERLFLHDPNDWDWESGYMFNPCAGTADSDKIGFLFISPGHFLAATKETHMEFSIVQWTFFKTLGYRTGCRSWYLGPSTCMEGYGGDNPCGKCSCTVKKQATENRDRPPALHYSGTKDQKISIVGKSKLWIFLQCRLRRNPSHSLYISFCIH